MKCLRRKKIFMSIYNSTTIRNLSHSYKEELSLYFGRKEIDDALLLSNKSNVLVGIFGLNKNIPYLQNLFSKQTFKSFASNLKKDSKVLFDYQNKVYFINKEKHSFSKEESEVLEETLKEFETYGGYLNDNGEHVIDLKSQIIGPHFAVNLLLGCREKFSEPLLTTPKSVVDQFGGGSFRGPAANQVLATRWDMDPRENGNPFNRQFYLLEDNKQIFYSHNVQKNVKKAICIHKVNRTEIEYETLDGLLIKRTIYIKKQKEEDEPIALERQVVEIKNLTKKERNLSIVFTGMFGSANPGCQMEDVIYQSVINQTNIIKKNNVAVAISPDYYPNYAKEYVRFASLGKDGFDSFSYDVSNFIGNGSIDEPEHLSMLGNNLKEKGPSFYALEKNFVLKDKYLIVESVGLVDHKHDLYKAIDLTLDEDHVKELKDIVISFKKYSSYLQVNTGNKLFDSYVNNNLPFQVLYQTYVSRAFAQTQKGYREVGFREIQDLYASMNYFVHAKQTGLVKSLLSKWIENVYKFGYVNHNFFFVGKEPGMCSDDGLWLVDAIYRYILISKDYSILNKKYLIAGSSKKRSLYDTLKAIITYSGKISIGKHGLPLLDKADWNDCLRIDEDCLDGPTKEKLYKAQLRKNKQAFGEPFESDLSESVMNAFLLKIALDEMESFASFKNDSQYLVELKEIKNRLVGSIQKYAYIDGYFSRVLINRAGSKYKYVGAPKDGLSILDGFDGSLYLNSCSWAILSKVASEEQIKSMIGYVDKYLKCKAGYKLCTPHDLTLCGSKSASTEQYFLGDRENGGVFKHATMMFVVACLQASKEVKDKELKNKLIEDANFMLEIVYPYNVLKDCYKYKGNPRFCTQYVNSVNEEHIGPILSGTSTWLTLAILEGLKQ